MHDRVCSNEGKRITLQTDKESQCLRGPLSLVVKGRKDILRGVMCRCQVYQGNQDPEEAENVNDEDNDFNGRQSPADEHVDEYTEHQYSPQEQCGMPILSYVSITGV